MSDRTPDKSGANTRGQGEHHAVFVNDDFSVSMDAAGVPESLWPRLVAAVMETISKPCLTIDGLPPLPEPSQGPFTVIARG